MARPAVGDWAAIQSADVGERNDSSGPPDIVGAGCRCDLEGALLRLKASRSLSI